MRILVELSSYVLFDLLVKIYIEDLLESFHMNVESLVVFPTTEHLVVFHTTEHLVVCSTADKQNPKNKMNFALLN